LNKVNYFEKYKGWFRKQPSLLFGDDINSVSGFSESRISSPTKQHIKGRRLHLRETLRKNELHFQGSSKLSFSSCDIYFDCSRSTTNLIEMNKVNAFIDFFTVWFRKNNIRVQTHLCGEEINWGNELWKQWYVETKPKSENISILISDFGGELPSGDLWNSLAAHSFPIIVWLRQPYPTHLNDDQIISCIENSKKIQAWKKDEFTKLFSEWELNIQSFLINYPGFHCEIDEDHDHELMLYLLKKLTS
jgi:hypothetical protein